MQAVDLADRQAAGHAPSEHAAGSKRQEAQQPATRQAGSPAQVLQQAAHGSRSRPQEAQRAAAAGGSLGGINGVPRQCLQHAMSCHGKSKKQ